MAILATVVVVSINPLRRKAQARDAARKSDISQVSNALKSYYTTNDTFPAPSGLGNSSGLTLMISSGDLKLVPVDSLGTEYRYDVAGIGVQSEAVLSITLEEPTSGSGNWVWCWTSVSSVVGEVTSGGCSL